MYVIVIVILILGKQSLVRFFKSEKSFYIPSHIGIQNHHFHFSLLHFPYQGQGSGSFHPGDEKMLSRKNSRVDLTFSGGNEKRTAAAADVPIHSISFGNKGANRWTSTHVVA